MALGLSREQHEALPLKVLPAIGRSLFAKGSGGIVSSSVPKFV
jgi:hypothetical protein